MDFDTRARLLGMTIQDHWEEGVKALHHSNKLRVKESLIAEYGILDYPAKRERFIALDAKPLSILAFHNKFQDQIRTAYVTGAHYPALVAACALGERILNHLILLLREDYFDTPEYKTVYRKESFDNWELAIDTLESWDVLVGEAATAFRRLADIRNDAIHFRPEVDENDALLALDAIKELGIIIEKQFGGFTASPWFIPNIPGESYIAKESESHPFISRVYIPNCAHVGPRHKIDLRGGEIRVLDDNEYPEEEVSDDEFRRLRSEFVSGAHASDT